MCHRHESELDVDLRIGLQTEAFEAVVELDVTEDSFRLDGSVAAVTKTPFACKQPFRLCPVGVILMVHLISVH